jgi:hypothetical protein
MCESSSNRGIKMGLWNEDLSVPGMLLSCSFESDLSHTFILYYYNILDRRIFEYWRRVVSKNKNSFTLIRYSFYYYDSSMWQEALEQSVINAAK